ncbi:L-threonylcarbamoyladenylate synthase [Streptomyces sp. NBRC 110611]|nr:L-threonylcarbamoyladenylate synthase [Streptomyces sp. NBRC 110611]
MLRAGGLVAFPTETVYGLGADAEDPAAVSLIFQVKGRPPSHPLIVHIGSAEYLDDWVQDVPATARLLAERFWPGPLTLVLRRGRRVPLEATGGLETVAVRVPDHPVALALLAAFGGGVTAPSANRFGQVSPTTANDVRAGLGDAVDFVLDGGPCEVGVESTIVDATGEIPTILNDHPPTPFKEQRSGHPSGGPDLRTDRRCASCLPCWQALAPRTASAVPRPEQRSGGSGPVARRQNLRHRTERSPPVLRSPGSRWGSCSPGRPPSARNLPGGSVSPAQRTRADRHTRHRQPRYSELPGVTRIGRSVG